LTGRIRDFYQSKGDVTKHIENLGLVVCRRFLETTVQFKLKKHWNQADKLPLLAIIL